MIYCRDCGGQMHETATACPHCGSVSSVSSMATGVPAAGLSGWLNFNGRISRKTYWLQYILPLGIGSAIFQEIFKDIGLEWISICISLLTLVASLAGQVKRCHDRDRTGWFLLLSLVPIIGWIWLFIELYLLKGTPGPNRFGPDPLAARRGTGGYAAA